LTWLPIGDLELSMESLNPEKKDVAKQLLWQKVKIINEEKFQNQIEKFH